MKVRTRARRTSGARRTVNQSAARTPRSMRAGAEDAKSSRNGPHSTCAAPGSPEGSPSGRIVAKTASSQRRSNPRSFMLGDEEDLAEVAARLDVRVGLARGGERERLVHDGVEGAALHERDDLLEHALE